MQTAPDRLRDARRSLAARVGLEQPFTYGDMAAIFNMDPKSADSIRKMEAGAKPISGPILGLLEAYDAGFVPAEAKSRSNLGRHSRKRLEIDDDDILRAVQTHGSQSAAARALGISVAVVNRRVKAAS